MRLTLSPQPGRSLADQLFKSGIEFPCGGETACGGCRVRILAGDVPVTDTMRQALTDDDLRDGWRLACCAQTSGTVVVEAGQWSLRVLGDEARLELEPRPGLGAAVDLGTTTLVAQLVDLATGEVLGVETALNPQARHGADVMSRLHYELRHPGQLGALIRAALGDMLKSLARGRELVEVLLAGNTAMHHLFCGHSVVPLTAAPFLSPWLGAQRFSASALDWPGPALFLPCLGGFVGSDLTAGIVSTALDHASSPHALLDIGTNGEIVVGWRGGLRCASTAAGPAFEGGRIGCGMRAGAGAIDSVHAEDGALRCHVIGGARARGICGSGLVDAVAAALQLGLVAPNGRTRGLALCDGVTLRQADLRELQLAKGSMATGLKYLAPGSARLYLAGAFGNYIRQESARSIGLLPDTLPIEPVGNAALRGTRQLLLMPEQRQARLEAICSRVEHVELASQPGFADVYAESMALSRYSLD